MTIIETLYEAVCASDKGSPELDQRVADVNAKLDSFNHLSSTERIDIDNAIMWACETHFRDGFILGMKTARRLGVELDED